MTGEVTRAAVAASGPTTTLIYDDWYPAIRAAEISGKQLAKAILLGVPLVLGRKSDGKYFAMRDLCPHRGIPLSYGWFDGQQVTCNITAGDSNPSKDSAADTVADKERCGDPCRIFATAYPCEERDGHLWVYVPQSGRGRIARPSPTEGLDGAPQAFRSCPRFLKSQVQLAFSLGTFDRRSPVQHRSRHHRVDRSGAWTICASVLVVAIPDQHS